MLFPFLPPQGFVSLLWSASPSLPLTPGFCFPPVARCTLPSSHPRVLFPSCGPLHPPFLPSQGFVSLLWSAAPSLPPTPHPRVLFPSCGLLHPPETRIPNQVFVVLMFRPSGIGLSGLLYSYMTVTAVVSVTQGQLLQYSYSASHFSQGKVGACGKR